MEPYDLEKLVSETGINEYFGKLSTNEQAYIAITGYIEINSNDNKSPNKFLNEIATIVLPDRWLEFFIRCGRYASLSDDFIKSVSIAKKTIDDGKVNSSNVLENFFPALEKLYIEKKQVFKNSDLLRKTAGFAFEKTKDTRYKLFRDYAFVYTSNDNSELTNAVKDLEIYLNSSDCGRDKRNIFYLQCLALMRIIRTEKPYELSETKFDDAYRNCVCPESPTEPWAYDYDDDDFDPYNEDNDKYFDFESMRTCYDLFSKIEKYNCPEVARFFENSDIYIETDFYRNLHKTVKRTVDNHKYSSERSPIVSRKIVFLSKPMIDPDFSPW